MKIARHRGMERAIVAVARRLAVIMHRMWVDGTGASRDQERSYKIRSRWSTAWERLPMGARSLLAGTRGPSVRRKYLRFLEISLQLPKEGRRSRIMSGAGTMNPTVAACD